MKVKYSRFRYNAKQTSFTSPSMRNIAPIMMLRPVEVAVPRKLVYHKFPNGRHLGRNLGFFRNQVKIAR